MSIKPRKFNPTIPKTLYKCPRCGYEISRKSSMRAHIHRKKLCPVIHKDIDIKTIEDVILNRSALKVSNHYLPH